ncbi:ethanolamine ammonia-lyase reactivating factor EutA [Paenibacillus qinlingensis]|uniref:ethanolamine ammonia-lyase reactivating factor EutA n=1 Tax=Paenibacillus qinlingensis TaxID=1837343 RepID=UPI001563BD0C|nr:ethanolamine ammonia-lyase reactivating factor EutA [Paenibacillus qinlingensis]NQX63712.1 ethanolamine ammonia-lyase reactivating factor EutA [Paenibacillus qinlingensis]
MKETHLMSIGLDIGTCTTKLVVSRLTLTERGSSLTISHDEITERKLLYASPIYRTPLLDSITIDAAQLTEFLERELANAGVTLAEIGSGAVIMTGETATKTNAEALLHGLAEQAGAFVVATAGSDLEAIMAGKGSGAAGRSHTLHNTVANMDIGGGTANVVWFQNGIPIATVTFHMGGSVVRLQADGKVTYVSSAIQRWLTEHGILIVPGQSVDIHELRVLARCMARVVGQFVADRQEKAGAELLLLGQRPPQIPYADEWMLSGGIAELLTRPAIMELAEVTAYNDIGPLLAQAILETWTELGFPLVKAGHMQRATVIGAGLQSVELSGSTVHADAGTLPMRNVPIMKLHLQQEPVRLATALKDLFQQASQLYGTSNQAPFGIALTTEQEQSFTYKQLQVLAGQLIPQLTFHFTHHHTIVMLCDQDMAKALGQLLSLGCQGSPRIVCIDGISLDFGDYIDLGELIGNRTIPVIVKTLIFPNETSEVRL